jgi:hypothetical protein
LGITPQVICVLRCCNPTTDCRALVDDDVLRFDDRSRVDAAPDLCQSIGDLRGRVNALSSLVA